jgi:hypothetical protein
MRIVTAINDAYADVLRYTLPRNIQHAPVSVYQADEVYPHNPDEIRGRFPGKPLVMLNETRAMGHLMVWIDADAWIIRPLALGWDYENWDIGVTMRRQNERGTDFPAIYDYLNAGVVFVRDTMGAAFFLREWDRATKICQSRSDQEGLNNLVRMASNLGPDCYGQIVNLTMCGHGPIRIKIFSTDEYNWSYWPETPGPKTKILHLKNNQRQTISLAEETAKVYPL